MLGYQDEVKAYVVQWELLTLVGGVLHRNRVDCDDIHAGELKPPFSLRYEMVTHGTCWLHQRPFGREKNAAPGSATGVLGRLTDIGAMVLQAL